MWSTRRYLIKLNERARNIGEAIGHLPVLRGRLENVSGTHEVGDVAMREKMADV